MLLQRESLMNSPPLLVYWLKRVEEQIVDDFMEVHKTNDDVVLIYN
jgi:hypothetical protein